MDAGEYFFIMERNSDNPVAAGDSIEIFAHWDSAQRIVQETVTVPAGTFSATRIPLRRMGKDIWLSSSVPFGIVKLADADDKGMQLIAYGDD